jgi:hypothetical protein
MLARPADIARRAVAHRFAFAAAFTRADGTDLGSRTLDVDFEPAMEAARFHLFRAGADPSKPFVAPRWDAQSGEPFIEGFRIEFPDDANLDVAREALDFSTDYFAEAARRAAASFVESGALASGERCTYRVVAFAATDRHGGGFAQDDLRRIETPPAARSADLSSLRRRSSPMGAIEPSDPPVFVPRIVLDEIAEMAREAGGLETGGILIGHLHRDAARGEAFVEVTAQIPARAAERGSMRLGFTAETWTAAQAAIDLRGAGEIWIGWHHLHLPRVWCRDCPPERRAACPYSGRFLSGDDRHLQRTVFGRAFQIGLLATDAEDGLFFDMFGWRKGSIAWRGFEAIEADASKATRNDER